MPPVPIPAAAATFARRVSVIGAGQMGAGIATVLSLCPVVEQVILHDSSSTAADAAKKKHVAYLTQSAEKGRVSASDARSASKKLALAASLPDAASEADLVIEAVSESLKTKDEIFSALSTHARSDTILASNTSSISITRLAAFATHPSRVIGMHFFNPVPRMSLVEVIPGMQTAEETIDRTIALCEALGKRPALVKDSPGFVSNRVLMPMINEAIFALDEGLGSREDIDAVLKLGANHPMGPLELADFIGLDTCLSIMRVLHEELGDSKYRPANLLVRLVNAGRLGQKTQHGIYKYPKN